MALTPHFQLALVQFFDSVSKPVLCPSELLNMVLAQCHLTFPQQTGKLFLFFMCDSRDSRTLASWMQWRIFIPQISMDILPV